MSARFLICVALVLTFGCAKPANQAVPVAGEITAVSFNLAGAPTVEFSAPDMMCPDGCGAKVKEILSEQPGAREVLVDFEGKKAIVAVDADAKFDANAALAALVDHGFKKSSLNANVDTGQPVAKPSADGEAAAQ
jgi:copper chaperone CopZ